MSYETNAWCLSVSHDGLCLMAVVTITGMLPYESEFIPSLTAEILHTTESIFKRSHSLFDCGCHEKLAGLLLNIETRHFTIVKHYLCKTKQNCITSTRHIIRKRPCIQIFRYAGYRGLYDVKPVEGAGGVLSILWRGELHSNVSAP